MRSSAFTYHLARAADSPHVVIPWEEWGPANTRALGLRGYAIYGLSGLHVLTEGEILNFNPFDITHDPYAPNNATEVDDGSNPESDNVSDVGWAGTIVVPSTVRTNLLTGVDDPGTPFDETEELDLFDTCMPYRLASLEIPHDWKDNRSFGLTLLCETEGPQVSLIESFEDRPWSQ